MATVTKVLMSSSGRITIPKAARRALGIAGETEFDVEVVEGRIVFRPARSPADEDNWAYTPEHLKRLRRALKDSEEGRVLQLTEAELLALTPRE
jgi:AbrB family looped-hinge helix DNA binding protein